MKKTFIFIFLFITLSLFSERISLNNGQIFVATIKSLDKKSISFTIDGVEIFKRTISNILKIEAETTQQSFTILNMKIGNEPYKKIYLIKMTNSSLYYKNINEETLLKDNFSSIRDLKLFKAFETDTSSSSIFTFTRISKNGLIDISNSINNLMRYALERKSGAQIDELTDIELKKEMVNYDLSIKNVDFYDLFWARVYKYIDQEEKELIWSLLNTYSAKEKDISIAYDSIIANSEKDRREFDNIIKELRYDFYERVENIILVQ